MNPRTIASLSSSKLSMLFDEVLEEFVENKILTVSKCDISSEQYISFISKLRLNSMEEYLEFSCSNESGLDKFFYDLMGRESCYSDLWEIFKVVLILSHGQADVERGFSINKDILKCNMKEKTIIAIRMVNDGMAFALGDDYSNKIHDFNLQRSSL